jgi:hypothetical protein
MSLNDNEIFHWNKAGIGKATAERIFEFECDTEKLYQKRAGKSIV